MPSRSPEESRRSNLKLCGDGKGPEAARTGRNVVLELQDKSKCLPGAAGQVEMSSRSSRTGRNVVREQQDRARKGRNVVRDSRTEPGRVEM